jgi:hypothetical protein
MFSFVVLLAPFVQLGWTYYASIATVAAVLSVLHLRREIVAALSTAGALVLFIVPLALIPVVFQTHDSHDTLRAIREVIIFSIMILIFVGIGRVPGHIRNVKNVLLCLALVTSFELFMAMLQFVTIPMRIYITFPRSSYVMNSNTLPELLNLIYSKIRPAATFGEPSYLGFFCLSSVLMTLPYLARSRPAQIAFATAIAAGILSQSGAFALALIVLLPFGLYSVGLIKVSPQTIMLGLIVVIGLFFASSAVTSRFVEGSVSHDLSAQQRVFAPLAALPSYMWNHPLGLPTSQVLNAVRSAVGGGALSVYEPLHNALFSLIFCYGIFGVAMIVILIWSTPENPAKIYIVLCSFFNGSLLSTDKLAIVSVSVAVFAYGVMRLRQEGVIRALPVQAAGRRNG